ncbi:hypothetical protein CRUP_013674, partial [Coryphaenoides rupestris]
DHREVPLRVRLQHVPVLRPHVPPGAVAGDGLPGAHHAVAPLHAGRARLCPGCGHRRPHRVPGGATLRKDGQRPPAAHILAQRPENLPAGSHCRRGRERVAVGEGETTPFGQTRQKTEEVIRWHCIITVYYNCLFFVLLNFLFLCTQSECEINQSSQFLDTWTAGFIARQINTPLPPRYI